MDKEKSRQLDMDDLVSTLIAMELRGDGLYIERKRDCFSGKFLPACFSNVLETSVRI